MSNIVTNPQNQLLNFFLNLLYTGSTDPEEETTRGGISLSHRGTTVIQLGVTPAITTTEDPTSSVSSKFIPSRRPFLVPRLPGVARYPFLSNLPISV